MSLETKIASLVDAANKLTAAVSGKMSGIDKKVDEATASMPNVVKGMMRNSWYVDAATGDDSNDGSANRPFQTLGQALLSGVPGSRSKIYLKSSQTHYMRQTVVRIDQQQVSVYPWGSGNLPEVQFMQRSSDDSSLPGSVNKVELINCSISFYAIRIKHTSTLDNYKPPVNNDSLYHGVFMLTGSMLLLDYSSEGRTEVFMGNDSRSVLAAGNRALSSLVLASADVYGDAGCLASNRFGGALIIRAGTVSKAEGVSFYPTGSSSVIEADYIVSKGYGIAS